MNYFEINDINKIDVELFVKNILMKITIKYKHHLRFLCFRVPTVDDKMLQRLEEMINFKKLLVNYTIKRVCDNIYLQWK